MSFDPVSIIVACVAAAGVSIQGAPVPSPVAEAGAQIAAIVEESAPQLQEVGDPYIRQIPQPIVDQVNSVIAEVAPQIEQVLPPQIRDLVPVPPAPVQEPLAAPPATAPGPSKVGGLTVLPPLLSGAAGTAGPVSFSSVSQILAPTLVFDPNIPRDLEVARRIIEAAMKWIGVPYQWGGGALNGPTMGDGTGGSTPGFDCSGLTRYALYQATGREIPRTSQVLQFGAGRQVPWGQAQPGDLVFGNWQSDGANHVAIYLGAGKMIEAPQTGQLVQISAVRSDMIPVRIV